MITEHIKRIEDNAISMLNMRVREVKPTRAERQKEFEDFLVEIFEMNHTGLSEPLLKRLARFMTNHVEGDAELVNRRNGDEILLLTLQNIGMRALVEEFKSIVK